jgi:SAM-dependent methyltransferase
MTHQTWTGYFEQTKNKPPRSLLVRALQFEVERNEAIDLGAGALNDSKYLLDQGFKHVTALDKDSIAKEIAERLPKEKFTYVISDFESYDFPASKFDLANAEYALPFIKPEAFEAVFRSIISSIKKNGILVGQLFGDRDEWKNDKNMNFHTLGEVKAILSNLEILYFEEEEKNKPTAAGKMKHWHVFHIIARKK